MIRAGRMGWDCMAEEMRADPDALLASLKEDGRGVLTVFLGAAAGVGKTYAMLETARERLDEGLDLVTGWVETHGRADTEALLAGLPVIPPHRLEYQGRTFAEMDLDALIARKPRIVLVDELAHSNIPGSCHAKRYQDVEELLAAGIDVYTTLNIQHLESLNDAVAQITGIGVRETVPDKFIEQAEIQLVDVPPEELIQRFKDGKVYVPDKAAEALRKFFRPGNINALREMALRHTAKRVDNQLETYMRAHAIEGPWSAGEKVMVCISPSPFAAKLIRLGRRMAANTQAEWFAVYVDTPNHAPAGETEHCRLEKNIQLAEDLGAETVTITGSSVADELLAFAKKHNITQIIIGKPLRSLFREWLHGSLVDNVIKHSEEISVHVISGKAQPDSSPQVQTEGRESFRLLPYTAIVLMIALLTALAMPFRSYLGPVNIAMLYLLPILISSVAWGRYFSVIAAIFGIISFDFFFIPPTLTFTVSDVRYFISFAIFLLVALMTGTLSARLRQHITYARQREARTAALYALSREISATNEMEKVLDLVVRKVAESVESQVVILMPNEENKLVVRAKSEAQEKIRVDENERAVAIWVYEHGQAAGRGTDTLVGADCTYMPIRTEQGILGVLGVRLEVSQHLSPEQRRLLEAFAGLGAMAVNRIQLVEQAKVTHLLAESERLHSALFNSISHELRTPLTSIIGAVTGLLDEDDLYDPVSRRDLMQSIRHGAMRMNRLVNNLLDMTRVESGYLQLSKEWCDVQDMIGVAASRVEALRSRPLKIVAPDLPLVPADFVLIEQVLVNLLDNAAKYSGGDSEISVTAALDREEVAITVADHGPGIPEEDRELVFDKFYRLRASRQIGGTGLGLTISKAIVEAHGGRIWVSGRPEGGTMVTFTLPLPAAAPEPEPAARAGDSNGC